MELYAAMVEHMDANIGKLIDHLKATNLYDNTLIIFLSDNGPEGNTANIGGPWDNSKFEDWGKKGTFIQYGAAWAQASAELWSNVGDGGRGSGGGFGLTIGGVGDLQPVLELRT